MVFKCFRKNRNHYVWQHGVRQKITKFRKDNSGSETPAKIWVKLGLNELFFHFYGKWVEWGVSQPKEWVSWTYLSCICELSKGFLEQPSHLSTAGIVHKISLENFLCHDNLEMEFNQHINFIIGRNGSGKSAILTGIVVALGQKASSTSRGSSIKGKHFLKPQ